VCSMLPQVKNEKNIFWRLFD
jgi:hypothetical protein